MQKRKIIILLLTISLFGILAEQIYQLVHHDIAPAASRSVFTVANRSINSTVAVAPPMAAPVFQRQLPSPILINQQRLITHQQKYIDLINQYQFAKMQRLLLEEEVAIAAARQRIAELNQKTQRLTNASADTATNFGVASPINHSQANLASYQLAYLDEQKNHHTATLENHGEYQEIMPGAQLNKNTQVKDIDPHGVLLQQGNQQYRLSFDGLTTVKKKPAPRSPIVSKKSSSPHSYTLDEILLLELPPTSYTIQLKAGYEKQKLLTFAKKNSLGENAIYYSIPRNHKTWNVLLYSYYNSKTEALMALQKLTKRFRDQNPKIQSIEKIQNKIKANKSQLADLRTST